MIKMPPREKIHEALSALADNRITIKENEALVKSSDYTKEYIVNFSNNIYSSNDNATYWQGYPGYPIIALLLLQNIITYDNTILKYFSNINWKELNKQNNNDYSKSVENIYSKLLEQGIDTNKIEDEVNNIYSKLENINIVIKRSKFSPPK